MADLPNLPEVWDFLQAQASGRAHDDREIRLGKARNNDQSMVTSASSHPVDSDPEEGNSPDESDQEHGERNFYRSSDNTPREVPELEEDRMTDRQKSARMQNHVAQQNFLERKKRHFDDLEKDHHGVTDSQDPSNALEYRSPEEDSPEPQSEEKAIPKTEGLHQWRGERRRQDPKDEPLMCRIERYNVIFPDGHSELREQLLDTCPRGTPSSPCDHSTYIYVFKERFATREENEEYLRKAATLIEPTKGPTLWEVTKNEKPKSVFQNSGIGFKMWDPFSLRKKGKERKERYVKEGSRRSSSQMTVVEPMPRASSPPLAWTPRPKEPLNMIEPRRRRSSLTNRKWEEKSEENRRGRRQARSPHTVSLHEEKKSKKSRRKNEEYDSNSNGGSDSEGDKFSSERVPPYQRPQRSPSPVPVIIEPDQELERERERPTERAQIIAQAERDARIRHERNAAYERREQRRIGLQDRLCSLDAERIAHQHRLRFDAIQIQPRRIAHQDQLPLDAMQREQMRLAHQDQFRLNAERRRFSEHTTDHSPDEDNDGEPSVQEFAGSDGEGSDDISFEDLNIPSFPDDVQPHLSTAFLSGDEKTGFTKGESSESDLFWRKSLPEETSKSRGHSFTAGVTTQVPARLNPSHTLEAFGKPLRRRESIEQLELGFEALSGWHEKDEEPGESEEAAIAGNSKITPNSDRASVLVPGASSVLDQQANAPELKSEVIRNALCTLSINIYHWTSHAICRWLVQSRHCSQTALINLCNFMRGCRRISWTCECGMRAHWDLPSHTSGTKAAALLAYLDRPSNVPSLATGSEGQEISPSPSTSSSSRSEHSTSDEGHSASDEGHSASDEGHSASDEGHPSTPPSSASDNDDGDVCVDIPERQEAESAQVLLMPRFIELCINSGRNKKVVAEIDLTEMKTDAEVFIAIAEGYRRSRKGRGCMSVTLPRFLERYVKIPPFEYFYMRPGDIIFRKFILYQHQCPEIAVCDPGLPPECEVRRRRYDYDPCPMELDEIMPAHHFFHILDNPVPHTSDTWMQRLPKKLHESLLSSSGQPAPVSWGIHINETPNWYLIFMTIFLLLLASGIFSITWAAMMKDVQGAFGIGAYVVAVLTAGMTALFFKCSEER